MPSLGDADGVHDAEVRRAVAVREALRADDLAMVDRRPAWLAEGAPHPLERAGVGIEHDDAVIAVAVGHEQLVGARMHPHIGGAMQVRGVGVALALVALADLHDELAVLRELQELIVGDRLEAGQAVGRAVVAADPDEALVVDVDAVLALGPLVAAARRRPRP